MTFDPRPYIMQLPKRVKDPETGKWTTVMQDYLEVRYRVAWFRADFPKGAIDAKLVRLDWEQGVAIFKATVDTGEGGFATAYAHETREGFADFVEKANTRSVGRALALLGYGSMMAGEELDEGEHVADSPLEAPKASTNGHQPAAPAPPPKAEESDRSHPTEAELATLRGLALGDALEDPSVFADRIRRTMNLKPQASVAPKLLTRTMSLAHYSTLLDYYTNLKGQLARTTEVSNGNAGPQTDAPATPRSPAAEPTPAVPSPGPGASGSAADDAAERDRQRLRQEVAAWDLRITDQEREYIITHHPYSKARALLWGARLAASALAS